MRTRRRKAPAIRVVDDLKEDLAETYRQLARMEHFSDWFDSDVERTKRLVRRALLSWATSPNPVNVSVLSAVYSGFRETVEPGNRRTLVEEAIEMVRCGEASPECLSGIVQLENEPRLIAKATTGYVLHCPVEDDPMDLPEALLIFSEEEDENCRAGVFNGLLSLGDDRICELLRPRRWELEVELIHAAVELTTDDIHVATVEFLIEWLEEVIRERDHLRAAVLAWALARIPSCAARSLVVKGRRRLPISPENPVYEDGYEESNIATYSIIIGSQLMALERCSELSSRMGPVLEAWGLPPALSDAGGPI